MGTHGNGIEHANAGMIIHGQGMDIEAWGDSEGNILDCRVRGIRKSL
jgi:hypothetical protein